MHLNEKNLTQRSAFLPEITLAGKVAKKPDFSRTIELLRKLICSKISIIKLIFVNEDFKKKQFKAFNLQISL
jgi:hypothetical protein